MKKLMVLVIALSGLSTMARTPRHPDQAEYKKCMDGELRLLEAATIKAPEAIRTLVDTEILENQTSCVVNKPRFFHPAVCGAAIVQIDTFMVRTSSESVYTVVVDSSYRSCERSRIVPIIKSMTYEPSPRVVRFP